MNWCISLGSRKFIVALPDSLVDQQSFLLAIDQQPMRATWMRSAGALVLEDQSGLEHLCRLRTQRVDEFDGQAALQIQAEVQTSAGMSAISVDAELHVPGQSQRTSTKAQQNLLVRSQITGKVLKVLVQVGDTVASGQTLLIIEAMKMENRVFATTSGVIATIAVKDGDAVQTNKELIRLAAIATPSLQ